MGVGVGSRGWPCTIIGLFSTAQAAKGLHTRGASTRTHYSSRQPFALKRLGVAHQARFQNTKGAFFLKLSRVQTAVSPGYLSVVEAHLDSDESDNSGDDFEV